MAEFRVLQVLDGLNVGGMEIFVMNYYRNINRSLVQFDFVIFENDRTYFENEINELGGRVYKLGKMSNTNKYLYTINNIISLVSFLKQNKYDIIHCHSCSFLGILQGSIAAKIMKLPVIIGHGHSASLESNSILDKVSRLVFKFLISKTCNQYFACSKSVAFSKFTKNVVESGKVTYINNAVNLTKFKYDSSIRKNMKEKLGIPSDALVAGIVGRLEYEKNHKYLLEIFKSIQEKCSNAYLLIVGSGSLKESIVDYSKRLNITNIIFTGNVNNPNDYYQAMDCFVLPSFYEGFPFVLVESQACGLPSFVSDSVTNEVCILSETKLLSIKASPEVWAEEILNMPKIDRNLAYTIVQNKGFDLEIEAERLCRLYGEYNSK